MVSAISFINNEPQNLMNIRKEETIKDEPIGVNFGSLLNGDGKLPLNDVLPSNNTTTNHRKKSTKTKNINGAEVIVSDNVNLTEIQTNDPYINSYSDTNDLLNTSIAQIDQVSGELKHELDIIRSSKTLKKKYDYMALMNGTLATLINTKVSAIRELNSVISNCHNLELKRAKDLNISESKEDDNKYIMDMYNAFISAPNNGGGSNYSALGPSGTDMTVASSLAGMINTNIGNGDGGYQNYLNNISPTQNMMRYETNPDVQEVVVFNQQTGERFFDVMNLKTGESISNVPKKDPMFMEDTVIDVANKIAKNNNLGQAYPLVLVGNPIMQEY